MSTIRLMAPAEHDGRMYVAHLDLQTNPAGVVTTASLAFLIDDQGTTIPTPGEMIALSLFDAVDAPVHGVIRRMSPHENEADHRRHLHRPFVSELLVEPDGTLTREEPDDIPLTGEERAEMIASMQAVINSTPMLGMRASVALLVERFGNWSYYNLFRRG